MKNPTGTPFWELHTPKSRNTICPKEARDLKRAEQQKIERERLRLQECHAAAIAGRLEKVISRHLDPIDVDCGIISKEIPEDIRNRIRVSVELLDFCRQELVTLSKNRALAREKRGLPPVIL